MVSEDRNTETSQFWNYSKNKSFFFFAIISVSFLAYWQVYTFEFCYDDFLSVLPIQDVEKLSSILRYFTEPVRFLNPDTGLMGSLSYYRPVATSTLTLDFFLYGKENPGWLHVENLLLHTINAVLFFLVARIFLKSDVPALFAALLYVVFPLSTEVVSIYHYRVDHVTSFFVFLTLLVTLRNEKKNWHWQAAGLFLCAMLSKEAAISLLVLIPLFRHFQYRQLHLKEVVIAVGIPMALYWPLRYNALGSLLKMEGALDFETATHGLSVTDWLLYISESFFQKLLFIVAPFFIPPKVFLLENVNVFFVVGGVLAAVFLCAVAGYYLKKPNIYSLLVAAFFISWFPVSSLLIRVPDFLSPRFFYYPSPWIVLLLTLLVLKIPRKNLVVFVASLLLTVWGVSAYYQKFMYKNNFSKHLGILSFTPDHTDSLWFVANEYLKRKESSRALHYYYQFLNASDINAVGVKREQAFQAHLMIAEIHLRSQEPEKALPILDGVRLYYPKRGEGYYLSAVAYFETGNEKMVKTILRDGDANVNEFEKYRILFKAFREKQRGQTTEK